MAINNIERALTIFRGIASRNKELATRYMHSTKYKQHNPHARDGVAGVEEWIDLLPPGRHRLATVRAFQDGPYVFAHTVGNLIRPEVFLDVFSFEDGLVVEHWVVWTSLAKPNGSGHTQTDGSAVANDRDKTESNKLLCVISTIRFLFPVISKRYQTSLREISSSVMTRMPRMVCERFNGSWKHPRGKTSRSRSKKLSWS